MKAPVIVGVAGGTGSGKTTLARRICEGVGSQACMVQHDWYYRDQSHLDDVGILQVNFDHPDSLDNHLLIRQLEQLKAGNAIDVPVYDFKHHRRKAETHRIEPCPVIVVEGILLFAVEELRPHFDIKLFVDTDPDIRVFRRIRRDIRDRGRDFESIRKQYYSTVRPMHLQFVEPSRRVADLIIPEGGNNKIALDVIIQRLRHFLANDGG